MGTIVTLTMNPALDIATSTDRVVPTHKLRCSPPRYDPGGGGINVARAVHALGGDAVAIFPIGGPAGEMIHHLLEQEGVRHHPIATGGFTRESLAVEDRQTGEQFRFILPGPEVSVADQEGCLDQLSAVAAEADFIVASGSLPLGVREDFYARVARLAQVLGKREPGRDPGDLRLLRRYERARAEDILAMRGTVHGLFRLFDARGAGIARLRNAGLNLANRLPVLKNLLMRQAMV